MLAADKSVILHGKVDLLYPRHIFFAMYHSFCYPHILHIFLTVWFGITHTHSSQNFEHLPGYLQPFGSGRPSRIIEEYHGFPHVQTFFANYVNKSRPLKLTGAAKHSRAYRLWDDNYFLDVVKVPADDAVTIESRKKENRTKPPVEMNFKDFVRIYNKTDQYMVESVPKYLRPDVMLPGSLHCPTVYESSIVEAIMWFSSGGTKSVVHTDSVDNILCLYRGQKQFVMVDPQLYADKVDLDHPEGAYSGVDVDRVDYKKYPGLAEVEFYHVNLTAGDCLFVPYKWIHQVRSYNRNLAVNVWWDHYKARAQDLGQCVGQFDPELTLDKVSLEGFEGVNSNPENIREMIEEQSKRSPEMSEEFFINLTIGEAQIDDNFRVDDLVNEKPEILIPLKEAFAVLDESKDGVMTHAEVKAAGTAVWQNVQASIRRFETLVDDAYEAHKQKNAPKDEL